MCETERAPGGRTQQVASDLKSLLSERPAGGALESAVVCLTKFAYPLLTVLS